MSFIGVYAPENGNEEEADVFYDALQKELDMYNNTDNVVISGNLYTRVENQAIEHFGEEPINGSGVNLKKFASTNTLKIINKCFRKKTLTSILSQQGDFGNS